MKPGPQGNCTCITQAGLRVAHSRGEAHLGDVRVCRQAHLRPEQLGQLVAAAAHARAAQRLHGGAAAQLPAPLPCQRPVRQQCLGERPPAQLWSWACSCQLTLNAHIAVQDRP